MMFSRLQLQLQSNHRTTGHDRRSISACRWSSSSHRDRWHDYATYFETSERLFLFWWKKCTIKIERDTGAARIRKSNGMSHYALLWRESKERSGSEKRRWIVSRSFRKKCNTICTTTDAQTTPLKELRPITWERQWRHRFQLRRTRGLMTMECQSF